MAELEDELRMTPLQLAALLGVMQWHCQLNRLVYSVLCHVYAFAKLVPDEILKPVPREVLQELMRFIFLIPCLEADLARPWLGEVVASDASPEFGFGLSTFPCTCPFARSVGRLALQPGAYAEVDLVKLTRELLQRGPKLARRTELVFTRGSSRQFSL